jgi:microcystin-dependent protein
LLSISEYTTLYELIGTSYGGDGVDTFALPDMRGRAPLHMGTSPRTGTNYQLAQPGGQENVLLTSAQVPLHTHTIIADGNPATSADPTNAYFAASTPTKLYSGSTAPLIRTMNPAMLPFAGGSQQHNNMQPYLVVLYCISLFGAFPSQT